MKRTPRVLAAVVAATALTFTGIHTADAKPDRAGTHAKAEKAAKAKSGKGSEAKLARDKARKATQLGRTISEKRLAKLGEDDAAAVIVNVEADQTAVGLVTSQADLRLFRVENYRLVVNVLRKANKLRAAATEATATEAAALEAAALVESAVAKALAVSATSPKADIKAARADLVAASALLDPEEAEVEAPEASDLEDTEDEPTVTDPVV